MVIKLTIKADRKKGKLRLDKATKDRIVRHLDNSIPFLLDCYPITISRKVSR